MSENDPGTPTAEILTALADRLGEHQVFGTPVTQGSTTLVPVARVRAGGGVGGRAKRRPEQAGGGVGLVARPAGAWAISEDGAVSWHPAVDVNRIVLGGQVALAAVLIAAVSRRRRSTLPGGCGAWSAEPDGRYFSRKPASTGSVDPVIHLASSETSHAITAETSSIGMASTGMRLPRIASPSSGFASSQPGKKSLFDIGLSTPVGWMVFTRIRSGASSRARVRIRPTIPCLAAV